MQKHYKNTAYFLTAALYPYFSDTLKRAHARTAANTICFYGGGAGKILAYIANGRRLHSHTQKIAKFKPKIAIGGGLDREPQKNTYKKTAAPTGKSDATANRRTEQLTEPPGY